jgi:menaquinone-dependent protoporphyrinogen oxidase
MRFLIVYGTTEGQTRKIADFVGERLEAAGHAIELLDAASLPADFTVPSCDRAIVAASLHAGRYQAAVEHFAARNRQMLNTIPTAFLSVSLAAAGDSEEDKRGLQECLEGFLAKTGLKPAAIEHVAGAFRYTEYDFLKRWAMKYIAWRKGQPTDTSRDHEYTDWEAVEGFARDVASYVRSVDPG